LSFLRPHLDILPERQQRLWPSLAGLARAGFVLYGGTAIALRYGHRVSVDFDFFSDKPLDRQRLSRALPWMNTALVLQDQPETLTILAFADQAQTGVKVSFFGGLTIGRVADPDYTLDRVALLASPHDLLATKLKVLLQRAERKDYQDVATLLAAGLALSDGLAAAQALYGPRFPVRECLKALVYFADGDLAALDSGERRRLEQAVLAVDVIPSLKRISSELGPSQP
jgi:hypothetical protein